MSRIYTMTKEAYEKGWDWDTIFANRATETVEEFDTYEEAVEAYEDGEASGKYDQELYGVE